MPPADKSIQRHVQSIGLSPGSIVIAEGAHPPRINLTLYDRERHEVRHDVAVDSLRDLPEDGRIVWVDVNGLGDKAVLEKLIEIFQIPWLAMEDVLHTPQRPKVDSYDDARFVIMRMFDRAGTCDTDQLSIFVRGDVLLTFQERPGDPFDGLRKRLAIKDSQLRQRGVDYFVYRLVDACVDSIFPELARISESVDSVEAQAVEAPTPSLLRNLHLLRRDLRVLERVALGTRDAMNSLVRDEEGFFAASTRPYLHDVLDHASQIVELSHFYTSVANDIGSFILGTLDMRMNQVMKILAGVTVVLMPLTLIAGIYGMNFENMPELRTTWGYFAALGFMGVVGTALTVWMWRLGWIRPERE